MSKFRMLDVCTMCGTTNVDPEQGYCVNGHDSWLEYRDSMTDLLDKSCKAMQIDKQVIIKVMNGDIPMPSFKAFQI